MVVVLFTHLIFLEECLKKKRAFVLCIEKQRNQKEANKALKEWMASFETKERKVK